MLASCIIYFFIPCLLFNLVLYLSFSVLLEKRGVI